MISLLKNYLNKAKVGTHNQEVRDEWIERSLRNLPAGLRLLDAGCGERPYQKFCSHLKFVSQDFGKYDGVGDKVGLQTGKWDQTKIDILCDIKAIPEPDQSFDVVLCSEVLEHVEDAVVVVKELARLTKPGGYMILTAPFGSLTHFAPFHFSTGFNRYFYETWLPRLGFEIEEIKPNGNFFEFLAQEIRRLPEIAQVYASRNLSRFERLLLKLVLRTLDYLSARDTGSSQVLNFGLHVRAKKVK